MIVHYGTISGTVPVTVHSIEWEEVFDTSKKVLSKDTRKKYIRTYYTTYCSVIVLVM